MVGGRGGRGRAGGVGAGASGWRGITCRRRALHGKGRGLRSRAWPRVTGVIPAGRAARTAPARPVSAGKKPVRGSGSGFPGLHRPSLRRSPFSVSISFLFLDELPGSACGVPAGDPGRHGFPLLRVGSLPSSPQRPTAGQGASEGSEVVPSGPSRGPPFKQALCGVLAYRGAHPGTSGRGSPSLSERWAGTGLLPPVSPALQTLPGPTQLCLRVLLPAVCKSPACQPVKPELPPVPSTSNQT